MAKAKNTISEDQSNIFDTQEISIESLIEKLNTIETKITDGQSTISEQIKMLEEAKKIAEDINTMLSDAKTQINVIEE